MVAKNLILTLLIFTVMIGIAVADGDQIYGTMSSECPDCAECLDVMDAMENFPSPQFDAQFDAMSDDVSTMGAPGTAVYVTVEEEWAYGRRNVVPEGIEHVYYDFEEGMNLYPFKNAYSGVASFENVSNSRCCYPACSDINEPSYVRLGAQSGPNCRCVMHIYPYNTKFSNGTELPYIHILNGRAAYSPRVLVSGWCYYPACSSFIGFKDDTHYVSFLASTGGNLNVRVYDPKGNYLAARTIYYTTDRIGDGPSNFTRFTIHAPEGEIGFMTFSGPFNGWHIDDMVVGGEPGYLPESRRYYGWAAERMKELIGAQYHPLGLGYLLHLGRLLTAEEIMDDIADPYYNPFNKEMEWGIGICPEAAIIWAYNEDIDFVNNLYMNDQEKRDFTEDVAYEDIQPGDVFFIDYPVYDERTDLWVPDGQYDEVGMVIPPQYDQETGMLEDCIRIIPDAGVHYGSTDFVNSLYGTEGFVHYRSLPDSPRIGKSPYPRIPGKPI